jgi:hypothetical protein
MCCATIATEMDSTPHKAEGNLANKHEAFHVCKTFFTARTTRIYHFYCSDRKLPLCPDQGLLFLL